MTKQISALAIATFMVLLAACGGDHASPTAPGRAAEVSAADKLTADCNNNKAVCLSVKRFTSDVITAQIWGELNFGLKNPIDANGGNVRLRVYDGTTFKTFLVGVFNSSPIGNTNVTLIRDIPLPASGKIDFAFYLEPFKCPNPSCWDPFVWENTSGTFPWNQYHVAKVTIRQHNFVTNVDEDITEVRIQGSLPPVSGT
jgi:hypothetical protein